ncbi:hypothetical protein CEXT_543191 [Caerostris extrusa]|uniref:Uncharacterized protein n=1 Tax=Caerostris extrusa TaxID=172846 RepID=A0AAV4Q318_CAEEX|nr:hypothetical protein CEXT_543191 [Caerostris extrusa]
MEFEYWACGLKWVNVSGAIILVSFLSWIDLRSFVPVCSFLKCPLLWLEGEVLGDFLEVLCVGFIFPHLLRGSLFGTAARILLCSVFDTCSLEFLLVIGSYARGPPVQPECSYLVDAFSKLLGYPDFSCILQVSHLSYIPVD